MPPTVLILLHGTTRDDIERASSTCGWSLANIVPAAPERPFQMVFLGADEHAVIRYIDDTLAEVSYLLVTGDPDVVRAGVPACTDEDLARMVSASATTDERARALHGLALMGASTSWPRGRLVEVFGDALAAKIPELRSAAMKGIARLGLSELSTAIGRVASSDREPSLRAQARALLGRRA